MLSIHCNLMTIILVLNNLSDMFADGCGSNLIAIEQPQSISTPYYPHQYRSNLTCTWIITTNSNYQVRLEADYVSNDTCCESLMVNKMYGERKNSLQ